MVRATPSPVRQYLQVAGEINSFINVLDAAGPRPPANAERAAKKNYAQYLSDAAAIWIANDLRDAFPEILPRPDGTGLESRARTGKGIKKLDINYSTPQLGLGLGISIKTLNFRDPVTNRYTKNPTRLDNELRAEALDYHERQPFAVMAGLVLVPLDACYDGDPNRRTTSRSSFAQIINVLRHRAQRGGPRGEAQLFEKVYVGLYEHEGANRGRVLFFDCAAPPPQFGVPDRTHSYEELLAQLVRVYDETNTVKPAWVQTETLEIKSFKALLDDAAIPAEEDDGEEVDF